MNRRDFVKQAILTATAATTATVVTEVAALAAPPPAPGGNTAYEWDEQWTAPDGQVLTLHRIDLTIGFNTGFMFDYWRYPEPYRADVGGPGEPILPTNKKRRGILASIRADHMGADADELAVTDEPYVPVEWSVRERNAAAVLASVYRQVQRAGWDNAPPGQCRHPLHITARMPNRYTGVMEDIHAIGCLPAPVRLADLILMAPAAHLFR